MATFSIQIEKSTNPPVVIVRPTGYFEENAGKQFSREVRVFLEKGERIFLFNFKGVPIMNSTGISLLLEIVEDISVEFEGKVSFCSLTKPVYDVFRLIGLLKEYKVLESEEQALTALQAS